MIVSRSFEFEMAHRLYEHDGKCNNLHGHNYKIVVSFQRPANSITQTGPKAGMVIDFTDLSNYIKPVISELDHSLIIWKIDPLVNSINQINNSQKLVIVDFNTTAENIGLYLAKKILEKMNKVLDHNLRFLKLDIFETDKNSATILPEDLI